MSRLVDRTVVAVLICSLAGCASYGGVPTSVAPAQNSYTDIVNKITAQQQVYAKAAADWVGSDFWYDTGLIVLAMGSVAVVAFSHGTAQANTLAGIGIGAGGVSLFRSAQNPSGKQQAYMKANVQLACLLREATTYKDWPTDPSAGFDGNGEALKTADKQLVQAIDALDKQLPDVQNLGQTDAKANLLASVLSNNLEKAQAVHVAAQAELSEAVRGLPLLVSTFTQIDTQAYTTAKGTQVTWSQATSSITQAIPKAPSALTSPPDTAKLNFIDGTRTVAATATDAASEVSRRANAVLATSVMQNKTYSTANAAIKLCAS